MFGDHALAASIRALEDRSRSDGGEPIAAIADAIRGRYDVTPGDDA